MRDYGNVKTAFWTDPKVAALPRDAKYALLYLLTSPHTNALGCFRAPAQYIAADMGESVKWVRETIVVLIEAGIIEWHEETGWVWIRNYLRHNPPANPKVYVKCQKELALVPPDTGFRDRVSEILGTSWDSFKDRIDTVSDTVSDTKRNPIDIPEPEPEPYPEPEPEKEVRAQARKLSKPEELTDFEAFWKAYPHPPNRGSKRKARDRWKRVKDPPAVFRAVANYAAYCASEAHWYSPKMAEGWLNGENWENWQEPAKNANTRTIDADRIDAIVNGRDPDAGDASCRDIRPALERPRDAGEDGGIRPPSTPFQRE